LAALAWSAASLVAFRVLQGAVGGLLAPLAQTLIAQLAGPKRMGRAVGIVSIPVMVSPLFGPVIGGLLVQHLSWRWLFLFNAPLGLLGAWVAHRRLPPGTTATRTPLDFRGLALLSPGMGFFTYALSSMGRSHAGLSLKVVAPLLLAAVLVVAFVLDARRRPTTALIDLRLFRHGAVVAGLTAFLLTSVGTFGAQLVLPLYYQQVRGESAMGAGLLLAPQGLGMLLTLPQVGKLTDRFDHGRVLLVGVVTTLLGTFAFTQLTDHSPYWLLCVSLVLRGAGLGATSTPALSAAYRLLARDEIPNATTAINVVQRLGAPVGTATLAMALQRFTAGVHPAPASAFAHTFTVAALLSALSLVPGIALARMKPKGT
jgi:EmrB/QacA subfamily drug resistance transporter